VKSVIWERVPGSCNYNQFLSTKYQLLLLLLLLLKKSFLN